MTPRVLHRIWVGPDRIPESAERYWARWQELNPTWTLKTWRDHDLRWLANRREYEASPTWSEKSDVARFEILARHGGVYVDVDVEPLRPIGDLVPLAAFAGWEYSKKLGTAVLGCERDHPAMRKLVTALPRWAAEHDGQRPDQRTGPLFLTSMWWKREDVQRLPRDAFYSVGWWEKDRLGGPYPEFAYAIHHWAHSWADAGA